MTKLGQITVCYSLLVRHWIRNLKSRTDPSTSVKFSEREGPLVQELQSHSKTYLQCTSKSNRHLISVKTLSKLRKFTAELSALNTTPNCNALPYVNVTGARHKMKKRHVEIWEIQCILKLV